MAKEMLINVSEGEECRIALVEDGRLEELYIERTSATSHVGNIYKGKVTNVEASIQAAFIDFGLGRNGFLHVSDLLPDYFGKKGEDVEEYVGKKMARRDRPPIQRCLRRGDEIIVQVIKEGIGTKGPTLSSYLSVSGKMLVMMPGVSGRGVSRKIEDEQERRRLKQILDSLDPPEDCGFIIRTEAVGKSKADIERDLKYLSRLWEQMKKKRDSSNGPTELYTEGDLVTRTIRDVFNTDVDRVIVDSADVADRVRDVVRLTSPKAKDKVEVHDSPIPLLHKYGIERDIELMYSRHVPLPSGGSLVIDSTEAIVAIDVNSGKFRDHSDAETTAFKTDMEAADEICRQLKLRDLGGVIIVDFIDLRYERHRRELEQRIVDNFKKDRAKTKVLRMSQFGIIEITRQRMRPSLKRSVYFDCPHCKGAGLVKTPESMSLDVMRRLAIGMNDPKVVRAELAVCGDVAMYLNNRKRRALADLEDGTKKRVVVKTDPALGLDEMRLDLYDNRDALVVLPELSIVLRSHPHTSQLHTRQPGKFAQANGGARPDDRKRGGGRGQDPQRVERERELANDRNEFDEEEQQAGARRDDQTEDRPPRAAREGREGRERSEPRRDDRGQRPSDRQEPRRDGGRDQRGDRGDQRDDRGQRPQQGGRSGRDQARPEQNRQDVSRRDEPRRDDARRDEPRRDAAPRDAARSDQPPRDDRNRDRAGRDQSRPAAQAPALNDEGTPEEGTEGGRRRRRRRRRGRGRGDQGQAPTQPLTAFGDYPEDAEQPVGEKPYDDEDREDSTESARPAADTGYDDDEDEADTEVGAASSQRDQATDRGDRSGRDDRGRNRRGDFSQAQTDDYAGDDDDSDDLGPAPEPVETDYEPETDFEPEPEPIAANNEAAGRNEAEVTNETSAVSEPMAETKVASEDAGDDESQAEPAEPASDDKSRRRRPARGGKTAAAKPSTARAASGKAAKTAAPKPTKGKAKAEPAAPAKSARKRTTKKADAASTTGTAPATRARIADATPSTARRRGADKHLVAEGAVDAEAVVPVDVPADTPAPSSRRSRSYRDLDAIPDDYD